MGVSKAITQLRIEKLHGNRDCKLSIVDNTLILVGENGSGKTTVLKIFFYILSGQISALSKYKFEAIGITIDGKEFVISSEDVKNPLQNLELDEIRKLPTFVRHYLTERIHHEEFNRLGRFREKNA
jgi:predicted ATP-binding protein involved in virulence